MRKQNVLFSVALFAVLSMSSVGLLAQFATTAPVESELSAEEQANKAVVEAYIEAQNNHDLAQAFALLSPDIVSWSAIDETIPMNREAIEGFFTGFLEAVPDLEVTVLDTVVEGDRVVIRFHLVGTASVEMMGQAAGSLFSQGIVAIYRIADGKIAEVWSY